MPISASTQRTIPMKATALQCREIMHKITVYMEVPVDEREGPDAYELEPLLYDCGTKHNTGGMLAIPAETSLIEWLIGEVDNLLEIAYANTGVPGESSDEGQGPYIRSMLSLKRKLEAVGALAQQG